MEYIITTAGNGGSWEAAQALAVRLGKPAVPRDRRSLAALREEYEVENLLVVGRNKTSLVTPHGEYYFHPSMAKLRIKQLAQGLVDPMVEAMALQPGDSVLDCTMGLAADALVSSYITGPQGRVVGLEGAEVLAALVEKGLQTYCDTNPDVTAAARRIEVKAAHHLEYLMALPEQSFDVVYFDPMFRRPQTRSSSMNPLRGIALGDPISPEAINHARRVARKRVVLKETNGSPEFKRLGFPQVEGGKYSSVGYGVWLIAGSW
ncbi:MAG: class I SAM-dependent methyltransferase [Clostridia bacterium]|nr:class I SAM-dependent methyltransferase [Clostridia bacterium]